MEIKFNEDDLITVAHLGMMLTELAKSKAEAIRTKPDLGGGGELTFEQKEKALSQLKKENDQLETHLQEKQISEFIDSNDDKEDTNTEESNVPTTVDLSKGFDSEGLPWDSRINNEGATTNKDGTWKKVRGIDKAEYIRVREEELRPLFPKDSQADNKKAWQEHDEVPTPPSGQAQPASPPAPPVTSSQEIPPPPPASTAPPQAPTATDLALKVATLSSNGDLTMSEADKIAMDMGFQNFRDLMSNGDANIFIAFDKAISE